MLIEAMSCPEQGLSVPTVRHPAPGGYIDHRTSMTVPRAQVPRWSNSNNTQIRTERSTLLDCARHWRRRKEGARSLDRGCDVLLCVVTVGLALSNMFPRCGHRDGR